MGHFWVSGRGRRRGWLGGPLGGAVALVTLLGLAPAYAAPYQPAVRTSSATAAASTSKLLVAASGDEQMAFAGHMFRQLLVVKVMSPNGRPLAGQRVDFQIPGHGKGATFPGHADRYSTVSNSLGLAMSAPVTAGHQRGTTRVVAMLAGATRTVVFRLNVLTDPRAVELMRPAHRPRTVRPGKAARPKPKFSAPAHRASFRWPHRPSSGSGGKGDTELGLILPATPTGTNTISGTVSDGTGSLSGVCVDAYDVSGGFPSFVNSGITSSAGSYTITGLGTDSYGVEFDPTCGYTATSSDAIQWYSNKPDVDSATPVSLAGGSASGINAVLGTGYSISGTVTDATTTAGVSGICVDAYSTGTYGQQGFPANPGPVATTSGGSYSITNLPTDGYDVYFDPTGNTCAQTPKNYVPQWYDNVASQSNATVVPINNGPATGVDAALQTPATISGTVTDASNNNPLTGICVDLWQGTNPINFTTTSSGSYTLTGITPGSGYTVEFDPSGNCPGGTPLNYVTQWYSGASSQSAATQISLTPGETDSGVSAALQPAGSISGTVYSGTTSTPAPSVCVDVYEVGGFSPVGYTTTASDGTYTVVGLATGSYQVYFDPSCNSSLSDAPQWYDDQSSQSTANTVSVTAPSGTGGINAVLAQAATISGTVTDASTGTGLTGICVDLWQGTNFINSTTTSSGSYTLTGITPASGYTVEFDPSGQSCGGTAQNYLPQWYQGAASQSAATQITLTSGESKTGVNAALAAGGQITGTVTRSGTSTGLQGICINALDPTSGNFVGSTATDSSGSYSLQGLATGNVLVQFDPSGGCMNGVPADYVAQWWNNQPDESHANPVSVTAGSTTPNIDAALVPGATITGTVTDASTHSGIPGVCVVTESALAYGQAITNSSGSYTITGLPAGTYTVSFDPNCSNLNYLFQTSPSFTLAAGGTQTENAQLAPGGQITGTVTAAAGGAPLSGVCVSAYGQQTTSFSSEAEIQTASNGTYSVNGLPTGVYAVQFDPSCGSSGTSNYVGQWYDDQPSPGTANPVSVTAPNQTGPINAALATGGSIAGTVSGSSGGLAEVCVQASATVGNVLYYFRAVTAGDGSYSISGLPASSYTLYFDPSCGNLDYLPQYYSNAANQADAQPVPVSSGVTSTANATLAPGGTLSGTVTNSAGGDLANVCVTAQFGNAGPLYFGMTDSAGSYSITGLATGYYTVGFDPGCGGENYLSQYYKNQGQAATATPVSVTAGQSTTGIGAVLAAGGSITGKVSGSSGGLPGVCVSATSTAGGIDAFAYTAADGSYTLSGLPSGSYYVYFAPSCAGVNYAGQYWKGATLESQATAVQVSAPNPTSGISPTLAPGGTITGQVTNATGTPEANVCVEVYDGPASEISGIGFALTDSNGDYTIPGLPAGSFTVYFYAGCSPANLLSGWYESSGTPGSTQPSPGNVTVTAGATTTLTTTKLAAGGELTGTVTAAANSAHDIYGVCVEATGGPSGPYGFAVTNPTGSYTMVDLPTASYTVTFTAGCGGPDYNYVSQTDQSVSVSAGATVTLNATLAAGATLSGTVTNSPGGSPVAYVCVVVWSGTTPVLEGFSDSTGAYSIPQLAGGSYTVEFDPTCSALDYAVQWWTGSTAGAASQAGAQSLTVPGGGTVTANATLVKAGEAYHALTPYRICDTRSFTVSGVSDQCTGKTLGPGGQLKVQVSGYTPTGYTGTVVPADATAVVMNVTATGPTAQSFLTVWPDGVAQPLASSLNFVAGQTVPNLVTTGLSDGSVDVFNHAGSVDVLVDVQGYYGPSGGSAGLYNALPPSRICDTRLSSPSNECTGQTLGSGTNPETLNVQVLGVGGVPNSTAVSAVVLNVTVTNPTTQSFLTVYPDGVAKPNASNLNFVAGETVPNRVVVAVGSDGKIDAYNHSGSVDVLMDVDGYFTSASGALFVPLSAPIRICDTRPTSVTGTYPDECTGQTLPPGGSLGVAVSGSYPFSPVPENAVAAVANVTVSGGTAQSFLTAWPDGTARPLASDLNWTAGKTVPNLVEATLGPDGAISVYNHAGTVNVIVDLEGYYA